MENKLKELRPVEKLYLISKEKNGLYVKKTAVMCLISFLASNGNIGNDMKLKTEGTEINRTYEYKFISLYNGKQYLELDKFLEGMKVFNQSLIDLGILKTEKGVKKRFWIFPSEVVNLVNTSIYYELQAHFSKQLDGGQSLTSVVCPEENKDLSMRFYQKMSMEIQAAALAEKKAKEKQKVKDAATKGEPKNMLEELAK